MDYKKIAASLLLLLTVSGYSNGSESPVLFDKQSDELLTQKMRDEFSADVEQIKQRHGLEAYESVVERINISYSCPTFMGLVRELATQFAIDVPDVFVYKGTPAKRMQQFILGDSSVCNIMAAKAGSSAAPIIIIGIDLLTHPTYALTFNEMRSVLAHECAHIREGHLDKVIDWKQKKGVIDLMLYCSLIATLSTSACDNLFKHYNIENKSYGSFITKYRLLKYGIYWVIGSGIGHAGNAVYNARIRGIEKEADIASTGITHDERSLISAMEKLERMSERIDSMRGRIVNTIKTFFTDHPLTVDRERYLLSMHDDQNNPQE